MIEYCSDSKNRHQNFSFTILLFFEYRVNNLTKAVLVIYPAPSNNRINSLFGDEARLLSS
ncbi:MAG: hypothetical protein IPN08_17580 [Bacteroidales bacterium]|nr:hypothetical protein [Bacteroidales bacterium]